ncbi:hypothetical protein L1887_34923 [Cichorium endivia]|nr:hypothetical protein L1887_34923 [Cichorium endivia]
MMPSSFPFIILFFRHENDRIHVYVDPFYEKLNDWIDEEATQENTCTDLFLTELCTITIQFQVEEEDSQSEDDKVSLNEEMEDLEGAAGARTFIGRECPRTIYGTCIGTTCGTCLWNGSKKGSSYNAKHQVASLRIDSTSRKHDEDDVDSEGILVEVFDLEGFPLEDIEEGSVASMRVSLYLSVLVVLPSSPRFSSVLSAVFLRRLPGDLRAPVRRRATDHHLKLDFIVRLPEL